MQQSRAHVQGRSTNLAAAMLEGDTIDEGAAQVTDERDDRKKARTEIETTAARVPSRAPSVGTAEPYTKKSRWAPTIEANAGTLGKRKGFRGL